MTNLPNKDRLYSRACESALWSKVARLDFAKMKKELLVEADSVAEMFDVDRDLSRGFVTGEFTKMKLNIITDIATETTNEVANARVKAEDMSAKFRRSLEELIKGDESQFERIRARLPMQSIDTAEFPELTEYSARLQQIESDATEQSINIAKNFTRQLANFLRQGYELELRLVFRSAFIAEQEVEELVQFYLADLSELHMAA